MPTSVMGDSFGPIGMAAVQKVIGKEVKELLALWEEVGGKTREERDFEEVERGLRGCKRKRGRERGEVKRGAKRWKMEKGRRGRVMWVGC